MNKRILILAASVFIFVFVIAGFVFTVQVLAKATIPYQGLYELNEVENQTVFTETFAIPHTETSNWDDVVKIVASDSSANSWYGNQVAIDGNIGVVGAKRDDENGTDAGAVYIVVQDTSGYWQEEEKLVASDGAANSLFGDSIAIDGDTLVVGAYGDSEKGVNAGAVYIFSYDGNNWIQQAKLTATDTVAGDQFGHGVSISGDTIVVGADRDDDRGTDSGSVYVFVQSGNDWTQQAKLTASDGAYNDTLGHDVSISGDTIAASAVRDDDQGTDSGSVYIYQRNGSTWTQQTKLLADDGLDDGGYPIRFGISLIIDGDSLIVGAFGGDGIVNDTGSAYVFVRDGSNWSQQAKLIANDGDTGDYFGWGVTINGNIAIVGALFNDELGTDAGAAYVFERSGSSWSIQRKLTAPDGQADARLGRKVAVSQNAILVGAEGDDTNGTLSGAAYFFTELLVADVFVSKSVSDATALPGQPITYTLDFGNNGTDIAINTMITDVVPAEVQNLTVVNSGVPITSTSTIPYAWQVGDMAMGEGGIITITGIISPELSFETAIVNTVEITSSLDVTSSNNVDTAVSQVVIPEISFAQSEYTVDEGAGILTLTAVLSPAHPYLDVMVDYYTLNGTAVASEDYALASGTLTFPAGISEATLTIPIVDDDLVEADETFSINFSNPVHAAIQHSSISITILDNEDSLVFLPLILNGPAEPETSFPVFIGDPISTRPVSSQGEVFYTTVVQIPEIIPVGGQFFLSADSDLLQEVVVDDEIVFLLDGAEIFVYTFSDGSTSPQPANVEIPRAVIQAMAGQEVTVMYRDVYGAVVNASEIWIQHVP